MAVTPEMTPLLIPRMEDIPKMSRRPLHLRGCEEVVGGPFPSGSVVSQSSVKGGDRKAEPKRERVCFATVSVAQVTRGQAWGRSQSLSLQTRGDMDPSMWGSRHAVVFGKLQEPERSWFESRRSEQISGMSPVYLSRAEPSRAAPKLQAEYRLTAVLAQSLWFSCW
ncbi:hypothetical protein SKAU_G00089170 [Synaphobranchus kaupii]|uniref:Uncharacterized protein n=1 Tax=Synaphobranchus kaupii TaxID=118154 RepID=A0A9Q1FW06_SYNKA|nr:hypothetical protein SKAU_G00089170 [Synaphobranchus kaupii]